jgi:regulator of cell morphogenesis and NO signaling
MTCIDLKDKTLGELAAGSPSLIPLFNRYKLDYCCGGKDTLMDALVAAGVDLEDACRELEQKTDNAGQAGETEKDWRNESIPVLVDYLLETHHVFMKDALEELNLLLFKILKVHFHSHGDTLLEVHGLFGALKRELEAHLVKEEEELFPMILKYEEHPENQLKKEILEYIDLVEREHDGAGEIFKKIAEITGDYTPPGDACGSFLRTYQLLDSLEKDTFNHIHLENTVLFGKIFE